MSNNNLEIEKTQEHNKELYNVIPGFDPEYTKTLPKVTSIPSELAEQEITAFSTTDYKEKSIRSIVKNSKVLDDSFSNSILAYAVYDKNTWMFDHLNDSFEQMKPKFSEAFFEQEAEEAQAKFFDLKVWHHLSQSFEKVEDFEIKIPSQDMQLTDYKYLSMYTYKNGQFNSKHVEQNFDIAHANIIKRKNPNGEGYILHLTYRGTEFDHLWQYIKGPYLDMSAYYENFKPLEKYIKEYVSDPKNNISELHVSGHSLGGSMVQEFLKNNPKESFPIPIKGFTFGSPGSRKNKFHKFITTAYHSILRGVNIQVKEEPQKDFRLNEFYHNNDPIPKLGLAGYSKIGATHNLFDTVREEADLAKKETIKKQGFLSKFPLFEKMHNNIKHLINTKWLLNYHDSSRYIKNMRNLMEDYFTAYPEIGGLLSENLPNLRSWTNSERKFMALSVRYKEDFLKIISDKYPEYNKSDKTNAFYKIRERMLVDTTAEAMLAKTRHYNGRPDTYLRNKSQEELKKINTIDQSKTIRDKMRSSVTAKMDDKLKYS